MPSRALAHHRIGARPVRKENQGDSLSDNKYTVYSGAGCTKCRVAKGTMQRAGAEFEEVLLDEPGNERVLADLKTELGRSENDLVPIPVVRTPDGRLLSNLVTISEEFRKWK